VGSSIDGFERRLGLNVGLLGYVVETDTILSNDGCDDEVAIIGCKDIEGHWVGKDIVEGAAVGCIMAG
jgi:hypothetical protein